MSAENSTIVADDGLVASEVGIWAKEKHDFLRRYVDICRGARKRFIGRAGATYIDLFSGAGRARIRETNEWIDGSAVVAWKASLEGGAPFSQILVADIDEQLRNACVKRLKELGAPVVALEGAAVEAAKEAASTVNPHGLHFSLLDPFNIGELNFSIIETLSKLKRIDMLVHISAMDLQRNLGRNLTAVDDAFDAFAPNWREHVDINVSKHDLRRQVIEYWRNRVAELQVDPSTEVRLITGERNQRLYWLLLAARHELAHKFWSVAANIENQGNLFK